MPCFKSSELYGNVPITETSGVIIVQQNGQAALRQLFVSMRLTLNSCNLSFFQDVLFR
jgi:hypothetical protein